MQWPPITIGSSPMFKALLKNRPLTRDAHALYGAVVAKSRSPEFYQKIGVPDSFDGRFEMMILHLYLVHAWLQGDDKSGKKISQSVFDLFLSDMDRSLREAAVGDVTVPKRLAKMTKVYYGRSKAYDAANLARDRRNAWIDVFNRNLGGDHCADCAALADYSLTTQSRLQDQAREGAALDSIFDVDPTKQA